MTVQQFSGNNADYTIGLICTSKHQPGDWLGRHKPRMDWITNPANMPNQQSEAFQTYLKSNLGFDSTRFERGTPQFTGHTALFARKAGTADWARGWVPRPGFGNYIDALIMGGETEGMWRDDLFMITDPTCVSIEFNVAPPIVDQFKAFCEQEGQTYSHYSFGVGAPGHCNCVWSAVAVLKRFAEQKALPFAARLARVQDPKQGHMMQLVMSGELLVD